MYARVLYFLYIFKDKIFHFRNGKRCMHVVRLPALICAKDKRYHEDSFIHSLITRCTPHQFSWLRIMPRQKKGFKGHAEPCRMPVAIKAMYDMASFVGAIHCRAINKNIVIIRYAATPCTTCRHVRFSKSVQKAKRSTIYSLHVQEKSVRRCTNVMQKICTKIEPPTE